MSRLIDNDPCLFVKTATIKVSKNSIMGYYVLLVMFVVKPASFGSIIGHFSVWRRRYSEAPSSAQLHFKLYAGEWVGLTACTKKFWWCG